MTLALPASPVLLELPPAVSSVGFAVEDHQAVLAALGSLRLEGVPERAVAKRRAEYLAGRFAALTALRKLGIDQAPGRNEDGSPRWPLAVVGSITHGAGRAWCAVAESTSARALGIDVERTMNEDVRIELARRICTDTELALLSSELPLPPQERLTLAFSAKESLYKCLYPLVGRFMDFHAAEVVAVAGTSQLQLGLKLTRDWSESFRAGTVVTAQARSSASYVETAVLLTS